jgi:ElaB/YqjD/DUF883 family membrane-anchored ribosome-binding protein
MVESTHPLNTPGHLLSEAWHYTKDGSVASVSKVWNFTREHPLPATMIGVGLGWLAVERLRGDGLMLDESMDEEEVFLPGVSERIYSGRIASAAGAVRDAAGHAVDSVKEVASTARAKVSGAAGTVKDRTADLTEHARESATRIGHTARHQTRRAASGFRHMMEENPLAVGAAALALGLIAGFSIRSTAKEDELLGETRDQFLDNMKEVGQEALEKGKHIAETAADTARREAEVQGLTPEGLADKVKAVGRETKNAVTDEVRGVGGTSAAFREPGGPGMA